MSHSLRQLERLLADAESASCRMQPHGLSVCRCHQPQQLHTIPSNTPTLMMVIKGEKVAQVESRQFNGEAKISGACPRAG